MTLLDIAHILHGSPVERFTRPFTRPLAPEPPEPRWLWSWWRLRWTLA